MKTLKVLFCVSIFALFSTVDLVKSASAQKISATQSYEIIFSEPHNKILPANTAPILAQAIKRSKFKPGKFYFVSADLSKDSTWIIGSFTDTDLSKKGALPQELYAYLLIREGNTWVATTEIDSDRSKIVNKLSNDQLKASAKNSVFNLGSQTEGQYDLMSLSGYKLPWTQGQTWSVTQGWHGAASYGYSQGYSIDFDIVGASNGNILAMAPGEIVAKCFGFNNQGFLKIRTQGTNNDWGYLHISASSIQSEGLSVGSEVQQGQKLGVMVEGNVTDNCGHSSGTHFHLYFPYKPETLDGVAFTSANSHYGENLTQSTNTIPSANCSGSSSYVVLSGITVNSGAYFDCYSTGEIKLQPNFHAHSGSDVFMTIIP